MTAQADHLQALARTDQSLAPLALLQLEALEASSDAVWERGVPAFGPRPLIEGRPLLDGQSLGVDQSALTGHWRRLCSVAESANREEVERLRHLDAGYVEELVQAT